MSKELELIRTLIDGANEYEKKTGNTNPTVYLSKNNLLVIEKALLKKEEPKQYVDELKLVEKKLKALEIIKEKCVNVYWFKSELTLRNISYRYYLTNFGCFHNGLVVKLLDEEEFNLLKEVLE